MLVTLMSLLAMSHSFPEEQFYRFLTLSNEKIAKHRANMISSVEKYFHSPEVSQTFAK